MRSATITLLLLCWMVAAGWAGELKLTVVEPTGVDRNQWPVTSGIPLAAGALRDEQASLLVDETGRELPLQTEVLARWPDGSIRWLLLDFAVDLDVGQQRTFVLRYGAGVRRAVVGDPLQVADGADGKVTIDTGTVRLEYDPQRFMPQGVAWLTSSDDRPDRRVTSNGESAGVVLCDENDRAHRLIEPAVADFRLEQAGPVHACLRARGWHQSGDARLFRYIARIHAYRGQPWIRVCYTFINDHPEALMTKIRKLELRLEASQGAADFLLEGQPVTSGRLFQQDEKHYLIDGQTAGERALGWAAIDGGESGLAVGLLDCWQNWPKAIDCRAGRISLELCPELPAEMYDGKPLEEENRLYYSLREGGHSFKIGVAKTHEFCVRYFAGRADAQQLGEFFRAAQEPLLAVAEPEEICRTLAVGDFPAADPDRYGGYDAWLDKALEKHLQRRERAREYGMLNYGDWFGERGVNWGNLEYDLAYGMFLQYLRSGDRRYFERGQQAARHHIDVDVVHATNPQLKNPWGPPPQVGEIWLHCLNHTGGYYQDAPLPVDRTYQMGHSANFGHVWVGGDIQYYLLTGDRRAYEVSIQMADAMVRHCPTAYSDHIRGLGWPIVLVLHAYELTGDEKYLRAATACWQVLRKNLDWEKGWVVQLAKGHCVHPERICYGNVPFMEGLTVSALARYHRITQDPEVLRAISVGIDQMIRECWVEEDKAFRYTACPLSTPRTYISVCLAAEAMAYESQLTGNVEHARILREGLREMLKRAGSGDGKSLAQWIHFSPFALRLLD